LQWDLLRQNEKGPKNAPMRLSGQFLQRGCQTVTWFLLAGTISTGGLSRLNGRAPAERESSLGVKAPHPSSCNRTTTQVRA